MYTSVRLLRKPAEDTVFTSRIPMARLVASIQASQITVSIHR